MARETNKLNLKEKLDYFIKKITNAITVDKIILFGSYAKGNPHTYSDIDLAVISPELDVQKTRYENIREVKRKADLIDPDLQLFAYPKETFDNELGVEKLFIREIKETGKVIYEKTS